MAATVKYKDYEIHLSSKYKGKAKPWEGDREMDAHKVFIKIGNVQIETDYYCHEKRLNAKELRYVLYLHLSDGISFKNAGALTNSSVSSATVITQRQELRLMRVASRHGLTGRCSTSIRTSSLTGCRKSTTSNNQQLRT